MTYKNTLIIVADDCPVRESEIPTSNRAKTPIHIIQYELLTRHPYEFDHEGLVFEVYLEREEIENLSVAVRAELWAQFFSKGHPCMRASSLTKRYGFGAHYNEHGRIAIYPMESDEYRSLLDDPGVEKLAAMRSKRLKG